MTWNPDSAGTYNVIVTATDGDGFTVASAPRTIEVSEWPGVPTFVTPGPLAASLRSCPANVAGLPLDASEDSPAGLDGSVQGGLVLSCRDFDPLEVDKKGYDLSDEGEGLPLFGFVSFSIYMVEAVPATGSASQTEKVREIAEKMLGYSDSDVCRGVRAAGCQRRGAGSRR